VGVVITLRKVREESFSVECCYDNRIFLAITGASVRIEVLIIRAAIHTVAASHITNPVNQKSLLSVVILTCYTYQKQKIKLSMVFSNKYISLPRIGVFLIFFQKQR
jgi:hypothetical protein